MVAVFKHVSIGLLVGCMATSVQPESTKHWKSFHSTTGFTAIYPAGWFPIGISRDRLDIVSSKGGAEGVVIKQGQARIVVMEAESSAAKTLAEVADIETHGASILSRKKIRNERGGQRSCSELEEIIFKEPIIPPEDATRPVPYTVNADFLCEIDGHKFATLVRNFEGDRLQEQYQRIALKVAESIRLTK